MSETLLTFLMRELRFPLNHLAPLNSYTVALVRVMSQASEGKIIWCNSFESPSSRLREDTCLFRIPIATGWIQPVRNKVSGYQKAPNMRRSMLALIRPLPTLIHILLCIPVWEVLHGSPHLSVTSLPCCAARFDARVRVSLR